MISSGIKRGLATTAVAALAVTGLPFLAPSASAQALNATLGANEVDLVQPRTDISGRNDGQNTTVRLTALGGTNVTSVKFEYALNGVTFQNIGTATRNDNGTFSLEWDSTAVAGAPAITLRATAIGPAVASSDVDGPFASNNTLTSVNLDAGDAAGVFLAPYAAGQTGDYVIVSGTTSSVGLNPDVQYFQSAGTQDAGAFAGTSEGFKSTAAAGATTGSFKKAVDVTGYSFGTPNEILLRASTQSDDAEAYALYNQTITTVTATANRTNVPVGGTANVTVTVADQNGNPIYGARVASSGGGAAQFTDVNGQVVYQQGNGTRYYYADATDTAGYQAAQGDKRSTDVSVVEYSQNPSSFTTSFVDGKSFDVDEYKSGDITVTLVDQNGTPINAPAGQNVQYYFAETPFDGSPATQRVPAAGQRTAVSAGSPGKYVIAYNAAEFTDANGSYQLFVSLSPDSFGNNGIASSQVDAFKAGQAAITYPQGRYTAQAGTSQDVTGTLALPDGSALSGRRVTVDYTRGTESNPAGVGDAYLVDPADATNRPTSRTVTTGSNGSFTVTVQDPAESPLPTELDGEMDAATPPGTADSDDPGATGPSRDVDFVNNTAPANATARVRVDDGDTAGNSKNSFIQAGEVADGSVLVTTPSATPGGTPVPRAGVPVTLTVDGASFFTDGVQQNRNQTGNLDNDGQSKTVYTDSNGEATFQVAVARSEEFDNDGYAADVVTATVASNSSSVTFDATSYNPLNGGAVELDVNEALTDNPGALPGQPVGNQVVFDVFAKDQFGNLVGDEEVRLSDDTQKAYVYAYAYSNFETEGDANASAQQPVDQTVTARWDAPGTTAGGAAAGPKTDRYTISWYDGSIANGTVTIESSPEGTLTTGSAVTETVIALDSAGNPIVGADVTWTRRGPGNDDATFTGVTDNDGESSYTFFGTTAGTANVTATVQVGNETKTATDQVVFEDEVTPPGPKTAITATLDGVGNGAQRDRLNVFTDPAAEGAVVNYYKILRNGARRLIATDTVDGDGNSTAVVRDANRRGVTKYIAKVRSTDTTKGDATNRKRLR